MADQFNTGRADEQTKGAGLPVQATSDRNGAIEMATYKLVDDSKGLPSNYEMVDATVRNHTLKVMENGKKVSKPIPHENMVVKVTLPDGSVVERPRYSRLIAIPRIVAEPKTMDEVVTNLRALADLIDNYDGCDRVEAPDLPDGKPSANVKRVALIGSKAGGRDEMPTPEYLWSAVCGAIRLDTQQNGQAVMRKKIESEMYAELGWVAPDKRVRGTKAPEVTTADRFAGMAGGDDQAA